MSYVNVLEDHFAFSKIGLFFKTKRQKEGKMKKDIVHFENMSTQVMIYKVLLIQNI